MPKFVTCKENEHLVELVSNDNGVYLMINELEVLFIHNDGYIFKYDNLVSQDIGVEVDEDGQVVIYDHGDSPEINTKRKSKKKT